MIAVEVDYSGAMAGLDAIPQAVIKALEAKVKTQTVDLEGYIIASKLQGQVLKHRSGKLGQSIHAQPVEVSGGLVTGSVASSADVPYAAIHEYGFDGSQSVKAHQRVVDQVFGRPVAPITVQVAAFTRHMVMPERSFMRSSLAEKSDEIVAGIQAAALFGAREAMGQ